jgi:hypothetical protein
LARRGKKKKTEMVSFWLMEEAKEVPKGGKTPGG